MRVTKCGTWLIVTLFLTGVLAFAAPTVPIRVMVVSSEQRLISVAPEVARDCNWRDISAYCFSSTPVMYVQHSMLVKDENGSSMRITCTVLDQWSRCASLPVGETFRVWRTKHAVVVRYRDIKGKQHDQKYDVVCVGGQ